jgi:hypothetical protein
MVCVQEADRALGSSQSGGLLHSLAVQVIVVVPTGYPSLSERLSLRTPVTTTLVPVAVGALTVTEASLEAPEVVPVWFAAQVIVGAGV